MSIHENKRKNKIQIHQLRTLQGLKKHYNRRLEKYFEKKSDYDIARNLLIAQSLGTLIFGSLLVGIFITLFLTIPGMQDALQNIGGLLISVGLSTATIFKASVPLKSMLDKKARSRREKRALLVMIEDIRSMESVAQKAEIQKMLPTNVASQSIIIGNKLPEEEKQIDAKTQKESTKSL